MTSVRFGKNGTSVPAILDCWDNVIIAQVVTCDTGAELMALAESRVGGKIWLLTGDERDAEATLVKVDAGLWELTCVLPDGNCPWCGTPLNADDQHENAVIGSACDRNHPKPQEDE